MSALGYTSMTGTVEAFRCWRVLPFHRLDGTLTYRLCAVGTFGVPKLWEPRRATAAVCSDFETHHEAPWPDHECGVWALKRPESARRRMVAYMQTQGGSPVGWAIGPVSLWGRLIEHEKGYRAQYAYPYALTLETPDENVARIIRGEYAVDVEWAGGDLFGKVRQRIAEKAAPKIRLREVAAELDAIDDRIGEIRETLEQHEEKVKPCPSPEKVRVADFLRQPTWRVCDLLRDLSDDPEGVAKLLAEAVKDEPQGFTSSRAFVRQLFEINDWDIPERLDGRVSEAAVALKAAAVAGTIVQLKRSGNTSRWGLTVPDPMPKGWDIVDCSTDEFDQAALIAVKATLKHHGRAVTSREIINHVGRPDTTSEKVKVAHALGRWVKRGVLNETSESYSQPNCWELA